MLAAFFAGLAVWWCLPDTGRLRRLRQAPPRRAGHQLGRRAWPLGAGAAVGLVFALATSWAIGVASGLATATACWVARGAFDNKRAAQRRRQVLSGARALAGLLRLGHVPARALTAAAQDLPVFAEPAAALAVGGDVPAVFHRLSATPGQSGLADLGLAWDVAQATGASLTTALDSMAERMDQEATAAQAARAELSAARSTSRILAALPFAGIGLGYGIGGDPLHFLTGSLVGEILLVTGMALACAGVLWTERIANG